MKSVLLSVICGLCFCINIQVYAGVSVEFSSLLSEADKLLASQLQYGGQAAEASQISGREPKMAYTTFEESEKLGMRLKHERPTRSASSPSQATPTAITNISISSGRNVNTKNKLKSPTYVKGSNETNVVLRKSKSISNSKIFASDKYEVGEARTVPLFLMGMFGLIEFVILTGVGFALITPIIGILLIVIKFMFTAGLIMIG